jgi:hypothetical protein
MFFQSKVLPEILTLDPERDHQRIVFLFCRCDFPFDTTRALEFALFRTFCVPSVGTLLDRTQEFGRRPQKRYDDTDIIISEIIECGYDSERGQRAIAQMNAIHSRFAISNADYLYVLSTFVFEPIRWIARFGWRPLHEKERLALFYFWRAVGERMHIRDLPRASEEMERYNQDYEREHFRQNPPSQRVAEATMRMFAGWAPWPLSQAVPSVMSVLMDEPLRRALGLPKASPALAAVTERALKLRGLFAHGLFPREKPSLRTEMTHRTYPKGYRVEDLGPDENHAPK